MNLDGTRFDKAQAARELTSFESWISAHTYFSEKQVVAEIAARRQMTCLLGYTILMPTPDLIKFEFEVKGLFRAHLVIGNDSLRKFVLIEFEDGKDDSSFKGGTRKYRYWWPRLEHGFGQLLDWGCAKHTHPGDVAFTNSFGGKILDDCYVVVCGRNPKPGSLEEGRLDFRRTRLSLNGVPLQLYTYDNLIAAMRDNLTPLLAR
jgi:hypothetical protein